MRTNVLLVEDEPNDVELLLPQLTQMFDVVTVTSLNAATDWLKEFEPDVILLDLNLPDSESGANTLAAIKQVRRTAPIVILSGVSDHEVIRQTILNTASGYVVKGRTDAKEAIESEIKKAIANHAANVKLVEATKEMQ